MSRIVARVLMVGLLSLPATAFAFTGSVYPTRLDDPDIYVDNITGTSAGGAYTNGTGLTLTGEAEAIRDVAGTHCSPAECTIGPDLTFTVTSTEFTITGENTENTGVITYLSGSVIPGSYENPGALNEYGELFTVTTDEVAEWSALEVLGATSTGTDPATNLTGTTVFFDFDSSSSPDGDMEPQIATPEPASLTLLLSGLAAGLLRKRRARKKA
jgi:hypothetical protein